MLFASRQDAGHRLGLRLQELEVKADLVVGLPRGGVVVAAEVANILRLPLEIVVVRKIGHPWHREFAVGALAEDGVVVLDKKVIASTPLSGVELEAVIREETERLQEYRSKFCSARSTSFSESRVLVVDDGLATGATAEAAVYAVRKKNARQIILAVPVASTGAFERLARVADKIVAVLTDPDFCAVGQYYKQFWPRAHLNF